RRPFRALRLGMATAAVRRFVSAHPSLRLKRADEFRQLCVLHIRYRPERHAAARPLAYVETADRPIYSRPAEGGDIGRNEDIDRVLAPLVDERRSGPPVEIVQTSANERETGRCEICHRRREVELPEEPR